MATIGELKEIPWEFVIQWKIPLFFSLSSKEDEFFSSSSFPFAGASWCLTIYTNGQTKITLANGGMGSSVGFIDVYLNRKSSGPPISLEYYLGLKTTNGKIYSDRHITYIFKNIERYGYRRFINRSTLLEMDKELLPSGELCVICRMKYSELDKITSKSFYYIKNI